MDIKALNDRLDEVNDNLLEWDNLGYTPNAVKEGNQLLDNFFEQHDRSNLSTDEAEELTDILDKIESSDYKVESLEAKFEKAQGKHGLDTMEDYAKFIDQKTRFEDSILASSQMSYYEYEALQQKARKKGRWYSERRVNNMIANAYLKHGKEGDNLYEFIYDKLSTQKPRTPRKRKNR